MTFTDADKLKEIRRELAQRKRVYPRLIEKGSLTQAAADRQTAILAAVEADYAAKVEAERKAMELALYVNGQASKTCTHVELFCKADLQSSR